MRDAILFAVGSHEAYGRKRTNADKRLCVELLLADEEWRRWSDQAIAKQLRVGPGLIKNELAK